MTKVTSHSIPLEYLYPQSFFECLKIKTYGILSSSGENPT